MTYGIKKRRAFHPSLTDARLEERVVLSSAAASVAAVAPLPAPPPIYSSVVINMPAGWKTVRQLRAAYTHQVELATLDLRNAVAREIEQVYADDADPSSQQLTDLNATVDGTLDATALRLSSQAYLLPASTSLVSQIQSSLLGSGSKSLSSLLSSATQTQRDTASALKLESAFARQILLMPRQLTSQFANYFNTTNVTKLAVNSSSQQIPLKQYMSNQVVNQLGNNFGLLAQSLPGVANAMLSANGTTGTATQQIIDAFGQQAGNALSTAAFQLVSSLSMFDGFSSVIPQIQPLLFGSTTGGNSLVSLLQNLPLASSGLSSMVINDLNTGFSNITVPINSFLGMQGQSVSTLPTTGLTNPFSSLFTGNSFANGFNNGFASGTNTGFVGLGVAPTSFNSNFDVGFNNDVTTFVQNLLGSTGYINGIPVLQTR